MCIGIELTCENVGGRKNKSCSRSTHNMNWLCAGQMSTPNVRFPPELREGRVHNQRRRKFVHYR